ncbi:MAG: acyltransferase [Pseudomonadota bacterium]
MQINTLRGLACVLLVLFHVVGNNSDAGLRLPADHWLAQVNAALAYLRMPLFAVIAGYVYAIRPIGPRWQTFAAGKLRRLLLPLLTLGTLFGLMQMATPGVNAQGEASPLMMHIVPVGHFWFLEAMLLIFALTVVLERLRLLDTLVSTLLVLVIATGLFAFARVPHYFAFDGALFLLPFFIGGLTARRFNLNGRAGAAVAAFVLLVCLALLMDAPLERPVDAVVRVGIGLAAAWLLFAARVRWAPLDWVGKHSYGIFLMHVFFTATARIILRKLGVDNLALLVPLGVLAGVGGPVLVIHLLDHAPWLRMVLLGEKLPADATQGKPAPIKVSH